MPDRISCASVCAVIAAMLLATAASAAGALRPTPLQLAAVRSALRNAHFSGSVLIASNGHVELNAAYGIGNTAGALYDIGSVAKLFTAAAVLSLDQAGRLSLNAPISRYLPAVPPADASITIRSLLTHTSGLPPNFSSDLDLLNRAQAVQRIIALPLGARGRFVYSNAGYVLLAAIVQQITHEPFTVYVQRRLLRRAGLSSTGWYHDPQLSQLPHADGYVNGHDRGAAGGRPLSWAIIGAGGMLSTSSDLYLFSQALATHHLLDRHHTAQLLNGYQTLRSQPGVKASFGGIVATTAHGHVNATGGDTDYGFTTDLRRFQPQDITTVILANSNQAPAVTIGFAIAHILRV